MMNLPFDRLCSIIHRGASLLLQLVLGMIALSFSIAAATPTESPGVAGPGDVPRLVATLQNATATTFEKARACQQLAIVGDRRAVPALASLLANPEMNAFARAALEYIEDPSAGDALRAALTPLQGSPLLGVVHSLGVRGETASIPALLPLVADTSRGAAPAALIALSRIDSEKTTAPLLQALASSMPDLQFAAAEGLLRCAERHLARKQNRQAVAMLEAVRKTSLPEPLRTAATRGVILAGGSNQLSLLLELLRSTDAAHRELGAQLAREIPGDKVAQVLAKELKTSPPDLQVALIRALADRKASRVHLRVEELAGSPDATVRHASLKALGSIGGSSSVPILIAGVANNNPDTHTIAADSLRRIQVRKADAAIVDAFERVSPEARARLIAVLGDRNATSTSAVLIRQATDSHPEVAKASFEALAVVASPRDLEGLIAAAMMATDPAIREKAERALYSTCIKIPDKARRSDALAAACAKGGSLEARSSLLQVMAMLGDATAYEAVAAAHQDANPILRKTAFQLLVNWPDATPVPLLLETFKETPDLTHRLVALRGVVTLSTLWTDTPERAAKPQDPPPPQALTWLREANAALRDDPEEKKTILSGLSTLNCAEGLRLLEPYLRDPSVQREAQLAYLRAARRLGAAPDRDLARPIVQRLLAESADATVRGQAEATLKSLNSP
ncbi:MAG: HEAT repeat domain-containing protein [Verrucomicrobiales bacterium]|nr:HEAT repeat domain-containing protein [Verrucomicrobiales bacterium]